MFRSVLRCSLIVAISLFGAGLLANLSDTRDRATLASDAPGTFQTAALSYLSVIIELEGNGYSIVEMERMLADRVRITAKNRVHLRELVVVRSTGQIRRDVVLKVFAQNSGSNGGSKANARQAQTPTSSGSSAGSSGVKASAGSGGVSASAGGVSVSIGN